MMNEWVYYILGTFCLIYLINKYLNSPTPLNKKGEKLGGNIKLSMNKVIALNENESNHDEIQKIKFNAKIKQIKESSKIDQNLNTDNDKNLS